MGLVLGGFCWMGVIFLPICSHGCAAGIGAITLLSAAGLGRSLPAQHLQYLLLQGHASPMDGRSF